MMWPKTSLLILLLMELSRTCYGYFVTIDAHDERCFYDKVTTGTKLGTYHFDRYCHLLDANRIINHRMSCICVALTFETSEGGFLDIDVKIYGPDGSTIHDGNRETSGKYTFAAHMPGEYSYCFGNKMSTMTPKVVLFNMEIGPAKEDKQEVAGVIPTNVFAIF